MDKFRSNPADSGDMSLDKADKMHKATSAGKSPIIIPVTFLLDVSSIMDAKNTICGSSNFQNSTNNSTAIHSENKDDITILYENTKKVDTCAEQNVNAKKESKKTLNNENIHTKILNDAAPEHGCCSLLKPKRRKKNIPESHGCMSKEIAIQNKLCCMANSKSNDEDAFEHDITIVDEVIAKRERYNPKHITKNTDVTQNTDVEEIVLDTVIIPKEHNLPDSKRINKNISEDNEIILDAIILNEMTFENESTNKNCIDDDVSVLDEVTSVKQHYNPQDSNSEGRDITENSIKIVDVFSVDTEEYNLPSEFKPKNKYLSSDEIMLDATAIENDNGYSSESVTQFTEVLNPHNSFKERKVLKEVNYSLLEKKDENEKNQSYCRETFTMSEHLSSEFNSVSKDHRSPLEFKENNKCLRSSEIMLEAATTKNGNEYSSEEIPFLKEMPNFRSSFKERKALRQFNYSSLEKNDKSDENLSPCSKNYIQSENSDSNFSSKIRVKCLWCPFATPTKEGMLSHMKEKHNESEKVKCPFCYFKPICREYLNHINSHLGKPPYLCSKCPYFTTSNKYFASHVMCHAQTSPKKFSCEKCSFATDILVEFTEHKDVHPPEFQKIGKHQETFSCDVCYKIFQKKTHLLQHQKIHKGKSAVRNDNFQCIHCSFSSTREVALNRHQTVCHPETKA